MSANLTEFQRMEGQAGGDFRSMDTFLKGVSRVWKKEEPSPEELQALRDQPEWVTANRLEPLLGTVAEDWKENYLQNWGRVKQHLQVFEPLSRAAERVGLKWIGYRGPFASLALAEDAALQYFADLDILVSEKDLEASLALFQAHGFEFRSADFPPSFYRKHHLHYSLQHAETGVLCDLHWAVDHPYTRLAIDYDDLFRQAVRREEHGMVWWEPAPEHRYILSALHAMKHMEGKPPADLGQALQGGELRYVLEAWALSNLDPDVGKRAEEVAQDWNAAEIVRGISQTLKFGVAGPGSPTLGVPSISITSRFGFRLSRLRELGGYLWPASLQGRPTRWTQRFVCACQGSIRLFLAALDLFWCSFIARLKGLRGLLMLALMTGAALSSPAQCVDDYPGGRESAVVLSGDSNNVLGSIEVDMDKDWFCFNAHPGASYQFDFTTNTIWDVDVTIHAPDGSTVVLATNTIDQAPAQWGWTNNGAFGRYYIELGGLVEFTTGTYSMVMLRSGFEDSDGDGLNDAWETNHFVNLDSTDGSGDEDEDGFRDELEYYLTTDPTNKASGLFIVDVEPLNGYSKVTWPTVQNGSYRISRAEHLDGTQTWVGIQTIYETNTLGLTSIPDTEPLNAAPHRFYRVEFLY